jgi:Zn-dependent M28 family amino/carboxypeptidase
MHRRFALTSLIVALMAIAHTGSPATAQSPSCGVRANNTLDKLLECVTLEGLTAHLDALQAIADANHGHRTSGTSGYDQSADYAARFLTDAGYTVTRQSFQFHTFLTLAPTLLQQVSPFQADFSNVVTTLDYSGSGDVTAPVSAPSGNFTGCQAADFAGFPAGNIALVLRGDCNFSIKATNADAAGALAVIVANNVSGPFLGSLTDQFTLAIPVVGVRLVLGQQLAARAGLVMRVRTSTFRGLATTENVIAESAWGDPNHVVMAGAHLDSVNAGAGINDNGSGVAAILETARHMARVPTFNRVRFALWGAEEAGLVGSEHYMDGLSEAERARIVLYLNFDMIASPNYVLALLDGDDSDGFGTGPGPGGSAEIERTLEQFYSQRGRPVRGTDLSGSSDYGPFMLAGIPVGGIFTGANIVKSAAEVELWGGTAGVAYDPCYHQACDTRANINTDVLALNGDAVAYAVLQFAMNTSEIDGQRGKGSFIAPPSHSAHQAITR